ncbi:hypothetical protein [Streptomyces sp. AA1529]|uniref:hypothetical protein n=1 Tax=Streptomyces sp. AA1529 TaxID=1203257 RepID=UPI0002FE9044|nr:hypothetical protein [Streptomyces sp. AA1529]
MRAARLAALLSKTTGHQALTTDEAELIRIEVAISEPLSETAHTALLTALRTADHFGFERVDGRAHVWATLKKPKA